MTKPGAARSAAVRTLLVALLTPGEGRAQAAALVGKLEGAKQWRAPALSGALQQDPRTRSDRFTLVAQLNDASADVPAAGKEPARAAR